MSLIWQILFHDPRSERVLANLVARHLEIRPVTLSAASRSDVILSGSEGSSAAKGKGRSREALPANVYLVAGALAENTTWQKEFARYGFA